MFNANPEAARLNSNWGKMINKTGRRITISFRPPVAVAFI